MAGVVEMVIGVVIGWLIAAVYYKRAAREQEEQFDRVNRRLDSLTDVLQRAENAGVLKLDRGPSGEVIGGTLTINTGDINLQGAPPKITLGGGPPTAGSDPTILKL